MSVLPLLTYDLFCVTAAPMRSTTNAAKRRASGRTRFNDQVCQFPGCKKFVDSRREDGRLACKMHMAVPEAAKTANLVDDRPPTESLFLEQADLPAVYDDITASPIARVKEMFDYTIDRIQYWRGVLEGRVSIPASRSGVPIPERHRIGAALIGYAEETSGYGPRPPRVRFAMPEVHHQFFLRAFEVDDTGLYKYSTSILTTAKKNMKSYSSAVILRACLDLPVTENPYLMVGAPTINKCELVNVLMSLYVQWPGWTRDSPGVNQLDAPFKVTRTTGSILKASSTWRPQDCGRLDTFGEGTAQQQQVAPNGLQFIDELGRMKSMQVYDDFRAAKTASVATPLIIISVLGSEHSPLDRVVRRLQKEPNERVYLEMHQAEVDAPVGDEDAIRAANPCLEYRGGPVLENILDRAAEAKRNPALVGGFKLEHYNLPANVTADSALMSAAEWERGNAEPELKGPLCIGLDLAANRDCAAVSFYDPVTYGLVSYAFFPGGLKDLQAREQEESIPYTEFYNCGRFRPSELTSIDEIQVATTIVQYAEKYGVTLFCIDPHLWKAFKSQLEKYSPELLNRLPMAKTVYQGGGNKGISPYIDAMRARCRDGRVHHGGCPMLRWGLVHTTVTLNTYGQAHFNKKLSLGSAEDGKVAVMTDVLISATMAVACLDVRDIVPDDVSKAEVWSNFREIETRAVRSDLVESQEVDKLDEDGDISDADFEQAMAEM